MGYLRIQTDYLKRPLWPDLNRKGPKGEPKPVTVREFAEKAGLHPSTVYDLIIRDRIYGVWVGGGKRLPKWYVYPHTYRPPGSLLPEGLP